MGANDTAARRQRATAASEIRGLRGDRRRNANSTIPIIVQHGKRQIMLNVKAGVPVIESVPEAARKLGVFDNTLTFSGYQMLTEDKVALDPARTFGDQDIHPYARITLNPKAMNDDYKVYDDIVEAVGDSVEVSNTPWTLEDTTKTSLIIGLGLLAISALCLATFTPSYLLAIEAFGFCLVMFILAQLLVSRKMKTQGLAVALTADLFAALGGYHIASAISHMSTPLISLITGAGMERVYGYPLLGAGVALGVYGLICMSVFSFGRVYHSVAPMAGFPLALASAMMLVFPAHYLAIWAVVAAIMALLSNALPWLSLSVSRISVDSPQSDADIFKVPETIDRQHVLRRYQFGSSLLFCLRIAVAVILILSAPILASAPTICGFLLCLAAYAGLLLDSRQIYSWREMIVNLSAAGLGLILSSLIAIQTHPGIQLPLTTALLIAAFLTVAMTHLSRHFPLAASRVADALEIICIVCIAPLAYFIIVL